MKKTFSKSDFQEFLNEMSAHGSNSRYRPVKEEPMPKGFFTSREMAKSYDTVHRVSQRWISELLSLGKLEVRFVRRKTNGVFVKKIPVYKFKTKADEKSFKSRHQGKL
jgi:hypothetical protein